jgi:hypothetical protein
MSWAYDVSLACRVLLGIVFVVSVVSKVHSRRAWRSYCSWLAGLPLRPLARRGVPADLVVAESAVVVLVAMPFAAAAGLVAGSALCLALTIGLFTAVRRGSRQPCHCFGSSSEPLGGQHVARNALLFASAVTGSACAVAASTRSLGWAEAALCVLGGMTGAILIIFLGDIAGLIMPAAPPVSGSAPMQRAGTR